MRDVLHWLPLRQRIEFRVAVLVWYSRIGQAPAYTLVTFVALPLAFGAPVTFARLNRASFMSHLLAPPPCRAGLLRGRPFGIRNGLPLALRSLPRLEYSPRNSFSNLKQHYSAAQGLGALLSIVPLEEALYKCLQLMNEFFLLLSVDAIVYFVSAILLLFILKLYKSIKCV